MMSAFSRSQRIVVLGLILAVSSTLAARVDRNRSDAPALPAGLQIVDWQMIRGEYERHRHAFLSDAQGFHARGFAQRWVSRFDGRGFTVDPKKAPGAGVWNE